jgi:pimeloyl-ACP methyl ester carboxylesterase
VKVEESPIVRAAALEGRARAGGIEIAYWVRGEGVPLLMIAGLAVPASAWGPLPQRLAKEGYRTIVIDNRDSGRSSTCEGLEYAIADMAGDVVAVLDDLGLDSTNVLALSLGGFIAQELALGHPERVEKLMLISSGPGVGGVAPDTELLIAMFDNDGLGPETTTRKVVELLAGPGWAEQNQRLVNLAVRKRLRDPFDEDAFGRQWIAAMGFSSVDRLSEIGVPTLLLHGMEDVLIPYGNALTLNAKIPQSELVGLAGAGHLLPMERPAETIDAIRRFFPTAT